MRIDRALAQAAVRAGRRIAVLCTVESTLGPTGDLFAQVAEPVGATVDVRLLEGLFASFLSGDTEAYFNAIANAADDLAADYDVIAFGQASMAPAAERCRTAKPLVSTVEGSDRRTGHAVEHIRSLQSHFDRLFRSAGKARATPWSG